MPARRSSLTNRSCNVPNARSTRSFACGLLAQRMSMFSSLSARPNCIAPSPAYGVLGIHPKDAVPVAVERDRLATGTGINFRFRGKSTPFQRAVQHSRACRRSQARCLNSALEGQIIGAVPGHLASDFILAIDRSLEHLAKAWRSSSFPLGLTFPPSMQPCHGNSARPRAMVKVGAGRLRSWRRSLLGRHPRQSCGARPKTPAAKNFRFAVAAS